MCTRGKHGGISITKQVQWTLSSDQVIGICWALVSLVIFCSDRLSFMFPVDKARLYVLVDVIRVLNEHADHPAMTRKVRVVRVNKLKI